MRRPRCKWGSSQRRSPGSDRERAGWSRRRYGLLAVARGQCLKDGQVGLLGHEAAAAVAEEDVDAGAGGMGAGERRFVGEERAGIADGIGDELVIDHQPTVVGASGSSVLVVVETPRP